jgi:hypothetical protein
MVRWILLIIFTTTVVWAQPTLIERFTFESGATVDYDPAWMLEDLGDYATFQMPAGTLTAYDYDYLRAQGTGPTTPPSVVLETLFNVLILDTKQAFDPAGIRTAQINDRTVTLYDHNDETGAYRWAHVPFSNALYGVVRLSGVDSAALDDALLLDVAATFNNDVVDAGPALPPPPGGRAAAGREMAEAEDGPLDLSFRTNEVAITFGYPEVWQTTIAEGGEVIASREDASMTFYSPGVLRQFNLAGLPTPDELAQDAVAQFDLTPQAEPLLVKAGGRPAVQIDTINAAGEPVTVIAVTFSDDRLGLSVIIYDDPALFQAEILPMLDSFDVAPVTVADLDQTFVAGDLSYQFDYPAEWTAAPAETGAFITVTDADEQIAINVYGPDAITALGLPAYDDPVSLCEAVITAVAWDATPAQRLRIDERAAATLIYQNPAFETEGRLYSILLASDGPYGYFDVVTLNDEVNLAVYEGLILDMLATFEINEDPGI